MSDPTPFTLRLLGEADLRQADGTPVTAVLRQPKRLALLAYLGAGDARFVSRDSLLATFWPGLDLDHGRAALRRAIYFLRQALGDEVLESRGDDIGLAEGAVRCDVTDFVEAHRRGDLEEALERYRGDLLPGFYVAGAAQAERWLDERRTHLRTLATDAARRSVESAPDAATAARWARRAHAIDPDDEPGLRRMMETLDAAGDRVAALRTYEEFRRRLALDLELDPDPETTELAETLRNRPAVAPGPIDRAPPVGLTSKAIPGALAVFPFAVRSAPDHAYLAEGMMDLLATALNGAGAIRTVEPRTVLARLGGQAPTTVTVERALAIARDLGAGRVILGSVVGAGGRIRVQATLTAALGQGEEARVEAEGRTDDLFSLVDEIVHRLLASSKIATGGRLAGLAPLTTESTAALRQYLTGEHAFRLGRYLEAMAAFRLAALEDDSFALAHYRLASACAAAVLIEPARQASLAAWRHRERLTEHDRLLVEAQHAWLHGAIGEAERRYGALVARHPEDLDAWFLLGDLLFHTNADHGRSGVEAREPLERTLSLDPGHVSALVHLVRIDALEGRWDDLERRVDRILALSPDNDQALGMKALRAFALHRPEEEREALAMLGSARGLAIAIAFSDVALYAGDLAAAERFGRAAIGVARSDEFRALAHLVLAHVLVADGRIADAWRELDMGAGFDAAWTLETRGFLAALPFVRIPRAERVAVRDALLAWDPTEAVLAIGLPLSVHNALHPHLREWLLGVLAARLEDPTALAEHAERLAELDVPMGEEVILERLARVLEAERLRMAGQPGAALAALEGARSDLWFQYLVASPLHAGGYERWLRAELLEATGRTREAAGWWSAIAERSPYELVFKAPARQKHQALVAGL